MTEDSELLPGGELIIADESEKPAILDLWPVQDKIFRIRTWILENYSQDTAVIPDLWEWANADELQEEFEMNEASSRTIIEREFKSVLDPSELDLIVEGLEKEFDLDWLPIEDRVEIVEDEYWIEGVELSLDLVKENIPRIRKYLSTISAALPPQLGHNRPPTGLEIDPSEIAALSAQLNQIEALDETESKTARELLFGAAKLSGKIAKGTLNYVGKKGDLFADKFSESAGETSGKWAVRGLVLYMAGDGLSEFAKLLMQLAGG